MLYLSKTHENLMFSIIALAGVSLRKLMMFEFRLSTDLLMVI